MMEDFEDKEIDQVISDLIERGLIEVFGIESETGEFTYRITEKCKQEYPELFQEHFSFVNELAFSLWEKGYIEVRFDDDGTPMVMLKDIDYKNDVFPNISLEEKYFIENMLYLQDKNGGII